MFPRKDPSKGPQKVTSWSYANLSETGPLSGWLAGPIEWVECHHYFRTVPCHWLISDKKLECPYCAKAPAVEWCGYVPLYAENGRPFIVIVRGYSQDQVKALKPFDPLVAMKGKGKFGVVEVRPPLAKKERYKSSLPSRQDPVDIRPFLLRLWKESALVQFFNANPATSDKPVSLVEQTAAADDVPPELAARVEAAKRARRVNEIVLGEVDALFLPDGTPIRLPKPDRQRNGKHE